MILALVMFFAGLNVYTDGGLTLNELGDFWSGGVGPLLSFAALIILYVAFRGQQQELELQREELAATREELAGQREQLELQNQQTEQRNFENTFFQLIRLHNDIVNAIGYDVKRIEGSATQPVSRYKTVEGRRCFRYFHDDLEDDYRYSRKRHIEGILIEKGVINSETKNRMGELIEDYESDWDIVEEKQIVRKAYLELWNDNRADLEHYFQSLFQVLSHAVKHEENTNFYIDIVVAQLSTYERSLLSYHYLSGYTPPELDRFIVKHGILGHLPSSAFLSESHIRAVQAKRREQM